MKLYKNYRPAQLPDPDKDTVETRILTALKTLRAVPDPDVKFLKQFEGRGVSWPDVLRSEQEGYGYDEVRVRNFNPTPTDVSRMLEDLEWLNGLTKPQFRLILWRSKELSFSHIAARIGRSKESARRRYREAIRAVEAAAYASVLKKAGTTSSSIG